MKLNLSTYTTTTRTATRAIRGATTKTTHYTATQGSLTGLTKERERKRKRKRERVCVCVYVSVVRAHLSSGRPDMLASSEDEAKEKRSGSSTASVQLDKLWRQSVGEKERREEYT